MVDDGVEFVFEDYDVLASETNDTYPKRRNTLSDIKTARRSENGYMGRLRSRTCLLYGVRQRPVLTDLNVQQMYNPLRGFLNNSRTLSQISDTYNAKNSRFFYKGNSQNRIIYNAPRQYLSSELTFVKKMQLTTHCSILCSSAAMNGY